MSLIGSLRQNWTCKHSSNGSILLGLAGIWGAKALPTFLKTPLDAKHWVQYHLSKPFRETLLSGSRFGRVPSWWTGRNPLWARYNACEMVRKRGENEKSYAEQLQNQLLFQIKQTIYFILVQKWTKMRVRISVNSSNIEANRAQVTYPFRVSLLYISAISKISYTSELGTAVLHVWQVCWFWSMSPYSWLQQKVSLQPTAQPLQRRMVFGTMVTAKILAPKFVRTMLRKLWPSSLWRVAERNLSHSAYSCQPPWWWIIDHLCQSAIGHTLP